MSSSGNGNNGADVDDLLRMLRKLEPAQRAEFFEKSETEPSAPQVGWCTDPLKLKVALNVLIDRDEISRKELAEILSSVEDIPEIKSMNYGLVGRTSNDIFIVEQNTGIENDILSLTGRGGQLAEMFDTDFSGLRPVEKTLFRGLSLCGHTASFLSIIDQHERMDGHPDGILKQDVISKMQEIYGGRGEPYTAHHGTLCTRLDLIERNRDGSRVRYHLAVPDTW